MMKFSFIPLTILLSIPFVLVSCSFDTAGLAALNNIEPACDDHVRNGNETDVDCGGGQCDPCEDGLRCLGHSDCRSRWCGEDGRCAQPEVPPTCDDGELNGHETDIDCGGPDCEPCGNGENCLANTDCESGYCDPLGVCVEPDCGDEVQNGNETDVDCGGADCGPCMVGQGCLVGTDCISAVCGPDFLCRAPSCSDGTKNGGETDVDCGGHICPVCDDGKACLSPYDCQSRVCEDNVCQDPSCEDNVRNGLETGLDCGGPDCKPCSVGAICQDHGDCASGFCVEGYCDGILSCKDLMNKRPDALSGKYVITTVTGSKEVTCLMTEDNAFTFLYVSGGLATRRNSDDDSCKAAGMILFTPKNQAHFGFGRDHALAEGIATNGNFLGPLGIYNPGNGVTSIGSSNWCGSVYKNCCRKKMIGGGGDDTVSRSGCGFTSLGGIHFWAAEMTNINEPSGDYTANCWLRFTYNASGNVTTYNDQNCDYSYSNYLCMALDDL